MVPGIAVRVMRSGKHEGKTHARNALLEGARGSIVLWQNEEVVDRPDWMNPDLNAKARRALSLTALVIARIDSIHRANDSRASS